MPMTLTTRLLPSHIVFDELGRPWVEGTSRKVVEIAIDSRAGLSAAQIHEAHPDLLPAKIHAAFAYYFASLRRPGLPALRMTFLTFMR